MNEKLYQCLICHENRKFRVHRCRSDVNSLLQRKLFDDASCTRTHFSSQENVCWRCCLRSIFSDIRKNAVSLLIIFKVDFGSFPEIQCVSFCHNLALFVSVVMLSVSTDLETEALSLKWFLELSYRSLLDFFFKLFVCRNMYPFLVYSSERNEQLVTKKIHRMV